VGRIWGKTATFCVFLRLLFLYIKTNAFLYTIGGGALSGKIFFFTPKMKRRGLKKNPKRFYFGITKNSDKSDRVKSGEEGS